MAGLSPGEVAKLWVKVFNRTDSDGLAALYTETATNHQVPEQPVEGREAIRALYAQLLAGPDRICIVENLFEDGDWAILEWRDPEGLRGCESFCVQDGLISFQRSYWDKLSLLRQHGLPMPRTLA